MRKILEAYIDEDVEILEAHRIVKDKGRSRTGTYYVLYTNGVKRYFRSESEWNKHLTHMGILNSKALDNTDLSKHGIRMSKDGGTTYVTVGGKTYNTHSELDDEVIGDVSKENKEIRDILYRIRQKYTGNYIGKI